jgi:hypothetical protein
VHALVLGSAEGHGCPESNVEVVEIFESSYQCFGFELTAIAFQRFDQNVGRHVTFERHVGSIDVDTQPGEFTEIIVTLPRAAVFV